MKFLDLLFWTAMKALPVKLQAISKRLGPLVWGSLIVFVISRFGDVANLICKVFVGRAIPKMDFGAFDPFFSVLQILAFPITVTMHIAVKSISRMAATGRRADCRAMIADLARIALTGSILSVIFFILMRSFIFERLHLESGIYVWIFSMLLVLAWWAPLSQAIIQAGLHYRIMAVNSVFRPFLILFATLLFVGFFHYGLAGAFAGRATGGAITVLIVFVLLKPVVSGARGTYRDELPFIRKIILPMSLFVGSVLLLQHFDRLMVRNFMPQESWGYAAIITAGMIPSYLIAPVAFVVFPMASAEHAGGRDLEKMLRSVLMIGGLLTIVSVSGLAFFGAMLLRLWRPEFADYGDYVWLYALATCLLAMSRVVGMIEMARHRYGYLWFMIIPAAAMCVLMYIWRGDMDIFSILVILVITRAIVLVGILTHAFFAANGNICSE